MDIFYSFNHSNKIISITGTNVKSTTCKLLYDIFKYSGYNTQLGGNIGKPVLSLNETKKKKSIFIIELSSYQLDYTKYFRPNYAAILNISFDHMERHKTINKYIGKDYILDGSFGIILPDDLILDRNSSINKMKSIYLKYKINILFGKYVSRDLIQSFGIIETGLRYKNLYLTVNKLLEKPNPEDTNSNLSILGRYYLNVKIFDYLHNLEPGHGGEIQLTDALSKMLSDDKFIVV